ncbi:twin-arginine translocation signal domain-containing protein [Autumnicola musiva]|uniref:GxGYxYP family putative glycoside hydrolase n=1 Tax=Autumnicola musiva TaxID=3075589 RepID=A0ABU3D9W7_9FLAO|nr:twin-arginine translocation signal domain-containing protein [Zunongwangia sp. F117]MDT0678325.1 GxGYxYP family putative glycoside hydrolase [Zunongwangia sp. F117]
MNSSNKNTKSNSLTDNKRRDFIKKTGMFAAAGGLGSVVPQPLFAKKNSSVNEHEDQVFYCDTVGEAASASLSYWESLFFRCYQGIVNRDSAKVYFNKYQKRTFLNWYKNYEHLNFKEFNDPYSLVNARGFDGVKGYVLIDPNAADIVNIAANYASLEDLIPITEELLADERFPNLEVIYDLRKSINGVNFKSMSRLEANQWIFENQWPNASRELVSITSAPSYNNDKAETTFYSSNSSRDYPVAERAIFFDLSSNPAHPEEYELKDKILAEMSPHTIVWGWHVDRDSEHQHIGQLSKHGKIAVGGANIAPNFSFHSRVKVPKGVENFKNFNKNKKIVKEVEDKVYLTFAMSDGDSLNHIMRNAHGNQWLAKDRGEIPFNWEMQLKLADIGPAILDYFQSTATKNDYFIASASGIGYTFPSNMPIDKLRSHLYTTKPYLRKTGMNSMVVLNSYGAVSNEKKEAYNEALGEDITGVMQGYTRAPGTQHLYGEAAADSIDDYMVWMSTALPVAHTDTVEELGEYLNLLAERRTERPLFVPVHLPRSYFYYSEIVGLMKRLDSTIFEAVDGSSFNAKFAHSHSNKVGLNLPEFFIPDPVELKNGRMNKMFAKFKNFGKEQAQVKLQARLTCDAWDNPVTSTQHLTLDKKEETELGFNLGLRRRDGEGKGQLEYLINDESIVKVPVIFKG